jgi:predicted transcriptional regulator
MVMPDGVNVHHVNASTTGGMFSIDAWIGDGFFSLNQTNISPNQLKIDIGIRSFPFANASSRLALVVTMEYESEISHEDVTEDEELGFDQNEEGIKTGPTSGNVSGFFTWAAQSVVDGTPRAVISSGILHGAEPAHVIYLNYPRGNLVIHDPKVGFSGIIRLPGRNGLLDTIIIVVMIAVIGVLAFFGLMMTQEEYRNYLLTRTVFVNRGAHRLSMDDVLDNETRTRILDQIIGQPGIHFKELLRNVETTSSNLAWHLDVLETYKIIHKQRVGHFLIYYPYLDKNPFATLDPKIAKSKTTLDIFQIVADNPGMYQNEIARRMGLDHKTAKYHLDKLAIAELITSKKDGRKTRFFPVDIPKEIEENEP